MTTEAHTEHEKARKGAKTSERAEHAEPETEQAEQEARPSETDVHGELHPASAQHVGFARRHPIMTVLGAAGLGLFGGIEMAAGVLLGAGVYAAVRGRRRSGAAHEIKEEVQEEAEDVGERTRGILDRATPELRQRARAIVQAARGKIGPQQT